MPEEMDHIEELQKRLYARDPSNIPKQKFGILRPLRQHVTSMWGDQSIPKDKVVQRTSVTRYKRFFIFALVFFLIGLGLVLFSVFRGAVTLSSKNVELAILGNSFVAGGEELPIQVEIANKNASDLTDVVLELEYPKGATDQAGSEIAHIREEIGTVGSGKTHSSAFSVILYGEQGTNRTITARLLYQLAGSTATFEKVNSFSVMINSSPITLTVDGPSVTASDQPFNINIRNLFTGDQPLANPIVRVEYPSGFTFLSASPAPSFGNNVWQLGTLTKNTEQIISIKGKLAGIENDEKAFRVYMGTPVSDTDNRIAVAYNSALHSLVIEKPFIAAEVRVNGSTSDVAAIPIGGTVNGNITWQNMTTYTLVNPTFTLALEGEDLGSASISADEGYYDSLTRTITWTGSSFDDLASLDPGELGTLPFTIIPGSATSHDDIRGVLSVEAMIPELENTTKSITALDEVTVRYAARLQFASNALYSTGPIKNTGPFPPKANSETTYTVTWTARPTDNPLSNIIATATLPQGVIWAGVIIPQAEVLTYNPDTREVKWSAGVLPKATAIPLSKSVSFQIKVRPTVGQIGTEPELLSETRITATDAVANVTLETTRPSLSTRLDTDPAYTPGEEKVLP